MSEVLSLLKSSFVVRLSVTFALSFAIATSAFSQAPSFAQKSLGEDSMRQQGRVRAPELAGGRGWLNTDKPLSLQALRGKVVLLDFWTYGCINCIHIIPDLKKLGAKYGDQLVVIGVHSAKFENEKEIENIRRIVLRYEIEHTVVNDADFAIWRSYTVSAWPTQVLIDPSGYVVGKVVGEGNYETLDRTIGETVAEFRKRGELNEQPLLLALERARVGDLPLAFPGKVTADAKGNRLFIADSNHNRIVVTKLDGTLLETIGTGAVGRADGAYNQATFNRPQGMALDASGNTLYVADTENHSIRRVDLRARRVTTLAGTGEQSREYLKGESAAKEIRLNSPWDLQLVGRTLYIAMAGPHQIWKLDLGRNQIAVFAGTGREARLDGARDESAFAQPSGLATDNKNLYVADSESNIIRRISFSAAGEEEVQTLAGGDLFDFGDVDGRGDDVRLQHPLGVVFREGKLLIADTYNHKIKTLDPETGAVQTFAGGGKPGQADGAQSSFYEPGGLSVANNMLYVADTNNHAVRIIDLRTRQTSTLKITGLRPPQQAASATGADANITAGANEILLPVQRLQASTDATLIVNVTLPAGYHLNASAPHRYKVTIDRGAQHLTFGNGNGQQTLSASRSDLQLPLRLPLHTLATGATELRAQVTLYYCREDNTGTCQIRTLAWRVPVEVVAAGAEDAAREIKVQGEIKL